MYTLFRAPRKPPNRRASCEPSDTSDADTQTLAAEAIAPHGGEWLEVL